MGDSGTWTAHHTLQAGTSMELRAAPRDQEGAGTEQGFCPKARPRPHSTMTKSHQGELVPHLGPD